MQNVIITGASSMIGLSLINEISDKTNRIYAVVRPSSDKISILNEFKNVTVVKCNLDEYYRLNELIPEKCDTIYHLAWGGAGRIEERNRSALLQADNVRYSLQTMDAAIRLGCTTFIGAGSQAEYGPRNVDKISPDTPAEPIELYGIAKYAAGKLLRAHAAQNNINCFWVRIFSVYGVYNAPTTMISSTAVKLLKGEPVSFTPAEQRWDYLNTKDAAKALYLIGLQSGNKVYCLGSGNARPLKEYITELRDIVAPGARLGIGEIPYSSNAVMNLCADISELTNDTGWVPEISFADGIRELAEHLKKEIFRP